MTVQRSRFLLTIKEDLTEKLRNCLHLVSVHDAGLKLTFGKGSRGFDDYNTVYFPDPETDMDLTIRRHFIHSSCVNIKYLFQAKEKLTSVQSKLCVDNKRGKVLLNQLWNRFSIVASADA